jgi:hypothetical protein
MKARARRRHRDHLKRASISDITAGQELAMRKRARKCPMCGVRLTSRPDLPNSKHLDHIVPLGVGGTHTHGNVRIICADCNLHRPKDGSDYGGPVTLWAQGPAPVRRADRRIRTTTCRNGLHPWVSSNIIVSSTGKRRCKACREATNRRKRKVSLSICKCGKPYAAAGRTMMCPVCIEATGRQAARLHQQGLTWPQVARAIGYDSGEGARYAAKRVGCIPAPKPKVIPVKLTCPCGSLASVHRPGRSSICKACADELAWKAVEMKRQGMTLQMIAGQLGYNSKSSITNLMKTVIVVDSRMGRPPKLTMNNYVVATHSK